MNWLWALVAVVAALTAVEVGFRAWYRRRHGRDYFVSLKFKWDENHVVAHPFLTFAYRRNGRIDQNQRLPYALWPGRYWSFTKPLRFNRLGHFGEDVTVDKPAGTLRVACLGSSSTANSISDGERDHCYPEMLKDLLQKAAPVRRRFAAVEVMNCGVGGWTTLDVLVNFTLNIVHYRPDYVILYQGLNDLPLHLMDGYAFDYAHGRRNLGEELHRIKRGYWFPKLRWWHSYEALKDRLLGTGNVRNEVLRAVETQEPDYERPYRPLVAEEMALRNLAILCRAHGIRLFIASYAFFLHNEQPRNVKLRQGIDMENALFRRIAEEFSLPFIDVDGMLPKERENFVDAVHLTPAGMGMVARAVAERLIEDVDADAVHLQRDDAEMLT